MNERRDSQDDTGAAFKADALRESIADVGSGGGESGFAPVTKHFEAQGSPVFEDPAYYKAALADGGALSQRLHTVFQKLMQAKDSKDRALFRAQILPVFWEYAGFLARGTLAAMPQAKRFLLRYAILHPGLLSPKQRTLFSTIIVSKTREEPVFYLDEWLAAIGRAEIHPSSTDETRVVHTQAAAHLRELLAKAQGRLDGAKGFLAAKERERREAEERLTDCVARLCAHTGITGGAEPGLPYTEGQKQLFIELPALTKSMLRADHEMAAASRDIAAAQDEARAIASKLERETGGEGAAAFDIGAIDREFQTVRQMAKLTVGRQGNDFPILAAEYFHCLPTGIGTRENVLSVLSWIESIDAGAFIRTYRKQVSRIVPYVLLLPTYGDYGVCWEPMERANKAASRGRIVVPMYPRNLTVAVLTAVADLRWQAAKEKASYYWLEEGLTGAYYQWFTRQKLKGDIKWHFIQDYLLWMTKESEGIQKLDKDVRGIFWRDLPFTRAVKERVKDRNIIYQELYQRDPPSS